MILWFKCLDTQALFSTGKSRRFANIKIVAERKLPQLQAAVSLESLRTPPSNHHEALVGNRRRQHSIRVNDPRRVCFDWADEGVRDVEIVDYRWMIFC